MDIQRRWLQICVLCLSKVFSSGTQEKYFVFIGLYSTYRFSVYVLGLSKRNVGGGGVRVLLTTFPYCKFGVSASFSLLHYSHTTLEAQSGCLLGIIYLVVGSVMLGLGMVVALVLKY